MARRLHMTKTMKTIIRIVEWLTARVAAYPDRAVAPGESRSDDAVRRTVTG